MTSIPKSSNMNLAENQCERCNYIFATRGAYTKHTKANTCKKTDFQCPNCNLYFSNKQNMTRHVENFDCNPENVKQVKLQNKMKTAINNSTNIGNTTNTTNTANSGNNIGTNMAANTINTGNTTNTTNNTTDNSNHITNQYISINLLNGIVKPDEDFELINDDDLNMDNIDKYLNQIKVFGGNIDYNRIVNAIADILYDKYIKNISANKRNLLTINPSLQLHYFKNKKWRHDINYIMFNEECIHRIVLKIFEIIAMKISYYNLIGTNDKETLAEYKDNLYNNKLNEIVKNRKAILKKIENATNSGSSDEEIQKINREMKIYDDDLKKEKDFYAEMYPYLLGKDLNKDVRSIICAKLHISLDDLDEMDEEK